MPQLLVRNLTEATVRSLKLRAAEHGVSTEEEHRRILEAAFRPVEPEVELPISERYGSVLREASPDEEFRGHGNSALTEVDGFKRHLLALGDLPDFELDRPRTFSKRRNIEL